MKSRVRKLVRYVMLLAVFAAAIGPLVPTARAGEPCAMMMTMDDGHASKGMMPACADMNCLIVCALPAPLAATSTSLRWSPVDYATADEVRTGRTVPPAQSPPIA